MTHIIVLNVLLFVFSSVSGALVCSILTLVLVVLTDMPVCNIIGYDLYKIAFCTKKKEKKLSEVGFEPTPTYVDQNTQQSARYALESGALDRSAILTGCLKGVLGVYLYQSDIAFHHVWTLCLVRFHRITLLWSKQLSYFFTAPEIAAQLQWLVPINQQRALKLFDHPGLARPTFGLPTTLVHRPTCKHLCMSTLCNVVEVNSALLDL